MTLLGRVGVFYTEATAGAEARGGGWGVHGHSRETAGSLGEEPGEAREPDSVEP